MKIRFLTWDWRGQLAAPDLVQALQAFESGPIYAVQVDSGTDDYVVALSDHPVSAEAARAAWQTD